MKDPTLIKTGAVGAVIAAVCCATPVLVSALGAIGLAAVAAYLDYVLLPALAICLGLIGDGLYLRRQAAGGRRQPVARPKRARKGKSEIMSDCCAPRGSTGENGVSEPAMPGFALRPGVTMPDWSVVASPRGREALQALLRSDHLLHRWSGYTEEADGVRSAVLQLFAETGRAPTVGEVAERSEMDPAAVQALLDELAARDLVVLDGRRIIGAYPFTDVDTGHR